MSRNLRALDSAPIKGHRKWKGGTTQTWKPRKTCPGLKWNKPFPRPSGTTTTSETYPTSCWQKTRAIFAKDCGSSRKATPMRHTECWNPSSSRPFYERVGQLMLHGALCHRENGRPQGSRPPMLISWRQPRSSAKVWSLEIPSSLPGKLSTHLPHNRQAQDHDPAYQGPTPVDNIFY